MHTPLKRAWLLSIVLTPACSLLVDTAPYQGGEETMTEKERSGHSGTATGTIPDVDARVDTEGTPVDAGPRTAPQSDGGLSDGGPITIVPDATVAEPSPPNQFVTLEQGDMSAVVIGDDDLPLVFFHATMLAEEDDLGVIECRDAACASSMARSLEIPGNAGNHVHARLDHAGIPILSYNQAAYGGEAKFMRCRDRVCTNADAWFFENGATAENPGLGEWSSIAFTTNGFPIVSYFDRNSGDLRAAVCHRADCCEPGTPCAQSAKAPTTFRVAGEESLSGEYGAVAVGADGIPVFAYHNASRATLEFSYCQDPTCRAPIVTRTLDASQNVGKYVSLLIGDDGLPLMFYYDAANGALKTCKCLDATCSDRAVQVIDGAGAQDVGLYTSAVLGGDGLPVVAYFDQTGANLKVAHCDDLACEVFQTHTVDGRDARVGTWTSIAIRPSDGRPVISYQDLDTQRIKLAVCGTKTCAP